MPKLLGTSLDESLPRCAVSLVFEYVHLTPATFGRRLVTKLRTGDSPGEALMDASLIFSAGILLVIPSILTDVAGLLLLIPPVRWLIVGFLKRRNLAHAHALRAKLSDSRPFHVPTGGDAGFTDHLNDRRS